MIRVNLFNSSDLVEMAQQLVRDWEDADERFTSSSAFTSRALVVISESNTQLVFVYNSLRKTVAEIDQLISDQIGFTTGHRAKSDAARLFAIVAELADAVDAGGTPIGTVGYIYTESGFHSTFSYPLERYKNDADVKAYLKDQEAALRAKEQAEDAANPKVQEFLAATKAAEESSAEHQADLSGI